MTEDVDQPNRTFTVSDAFREFVTTGWSDDEIDTTALASAPYAKKRREKLSALFPADRLVIPAGEFKVRSNDTDYRFRPHSAFSWATGLGTDKEPNAVLVMEPGEEGHQSTLYFHPRSPRNSDEFFGDARYGEMWVGRRETLTELSELTQLATADIADLDAALEKNVHELTSRIIRSADPDFTTRFDELRTKEGANDLDAVLAADHDLTVAASELRFVKDDYEIDQMQQACAQTATAFGEVVRQFPEAVRRGRGERWVEGVFGLHARHAGNAVGYDSIVGNGDHATTLHWIKNDGDLKPGDLILIDAGIELDSLYTADVTRTFPVNGTFSAPQRKIYEAVLAAQRAGIAAAQPGAKFADVHAAAIAVITQHLADWSLLPVSVEEALDLKTGGHYRRWMPHGTSHHLGIDVHDCAQARTEEYRGGTLKPGMIITVEPGLYFKHNDELVPAEFRGIGVRIEDDILITETGNKNLSEQLPRDPDELQKWMQPLLADDSN